MYGLETAAPMKRQEAELKTAEDEDYWVRNECVRGREHVRCFEEIVREARLRWYVHVLRRNSEYIGSRIMRCERPDKRP